MLGDSAFLLFPLITLRLTYIAVCYAIQTLGEPKDFFFPNCGYKQKKRLEKITTWTLQLMQNYLL